VEVTRWLALLAEIRAEDAGGYAAERPEPWIEAAVARLQTMTNAPDWEKLAREFGLTYEQFRKRFGAAMACHRPTTDSRGVWTGRRCGCRQMTRR
jgi:hypothetical protein